jgi:hypothetical protein
MKGECECIDLADAKQAFCNRCVDLACKNQRLHDESAKTYPRSMSSLGRRCIRFGNRSSEDELIDLASQIRVIVGCS